jgi:hypothetical protein
MCVLLRGARYIKVAKEQGKDVVDDLCNACDLGHYRKAIEAMESLALEPPNDGKGKAKGKCLLDWIQVIVRHSFTSDALAGLVSASSLVVVRVGGAVRIWHIRCSALVSAFHFCLFIVRSLTALHFLEYIHSYLQNLSVYQSTFSYTVSSNLVSSK